MPNSKKPFETVFIDISHLDYLLIVRVKALRTDRGFSQVVLTQKMGLSEGFVGKVELFTERAKYNIRHLYLIAKSFECKLEDILPLEQPQHDMVRLTLQRMNKVNKDGTISNKKTTEVIKIEPIEKKHLGKEK